MFCAREKYCFSYLNIKDTRFTYEMK